MADFDLEIQGLDQLEQALLQLAEPAANRALRKGMRVGSNVIRDEIRSRAPVDTGTLKKEIKVRKLRDRPGSIAFKIGVKTMRKVYANTKRNRRMRRAGKVYEVDGAGYYAKFNEYGTSKMTAQPFMRPGAEAKAEEAVGSMQSALSEAIDEELRKIRR